MNLSKLASKIDICCSKRRISRAAEGWPSRSRPDIKLKKVGNVQFRYRERGRGVPIVFAADPPVTLELYDELLDVYASRFRVIVFELPGMGFSMADFGFNYSFQAVNDSIIGLFDAILDQPAVLAFSCASGLGSIDIACRRPDLVIKLVLIQTPSWEQEVLWKNSRDPKNILAKPVIGQIAMHFLKQKRAPNWFELAVGKKEHFAPFCDSAEETLSRGAGWTLASAFQSYLTNNNPALLVAKQPLLALWGELDKTHMNTDKRSSLSLAVNSEIQLYNDLGHFPDLEGVVRVFRDISHFAG